MKKTLVCLLAAFVTFNSLGVAIDCSYSTIGVYSDGSAWAITMEYVTTNGDCCSPTAGSAMVTYYSEYSTGGVTSNSYVSNSTAANINPSCGGSRQYD